MKKIAAFAVAPLLLGLLSVPAYAETGEPKDIEDLTLLATTDLHGTWVDYDYFTGGPFDGHKAPEDRDVRGMDHLSTVINDIRKDKGDDAVILLDNGDAAQGSSIQTVYQKYKDETTKDPAASVFNYLKYDAIVSGNHEFNYGLESLDAYRKSLDMPFLAANVFKRADGKPAYQQYEILRKVTKDGHEVKVGVVGVVTPGVPGWDGAKVASLEFRDQVQVLQTLVPEVRDKGADVIIVLAHTGIDPDGYRWDPADLQENAARSIAENVSGIDVLVAGHSHAKDKVQKYYENPDGREVLLTQPGFHARFLSNVNIPLSLKDGKVQVDWTENVKPAAKAEFAKGQAQDPGIFEQVKSWHEKTVEWVGTVVAQSTEEMKSETSAWEDTAILDFINKVQIDELTRALKGTEYEGLPIVAEVSPFSRTAVFKKGDVTIADMAAIYIYDNTLFGIKLTGAQLKDYLEWSARYFKQQEPGTVIEDWSAVTNAQYEGMTRGLPDYTYDVLSGVNYHIDVSKPVDKRVEGLSMPDGTPVNDTDEFVLALNNYRQSGGSGYPHVKTAPIVYDEQKAIRDLMIEWAQEKGVIDPAEFFENNWSVANAPAGAEVPDVKDPSEGSSEGAGEEPSGKPSEGGSDVKPSVKPVPEVSVTEMQGKGKSGSLASTGSEAATLAGIAGLLLAAGAGLVLYRRSERVS
ncbi:MAG: 5'-nucleotidase C-terminal domain-containing protein [Actinomycetaceae bacterium]|nr:5'-nucleotidase C-terminal domain-containing protein [Actinomycetaceae bacterium]